MIPLIFTITAILLLTAILDFAMPRTALRQRRTILLLTVCALLLVPALRHTIQQLPTATALDPTTPWLQSSTLPASISTSTFPANLLWLWTIGAAFMLMRLLYRLAAMRRFLHDATPFSQPWLDRAARLTCSQNPTPLPRLFWKPGLGSACTTPSLPPAIALPIEAQQWDDATLKSVLQHEREHLRLGDVWWRLVAEAALALWWWHPLAHRVVKRWQANSECLCDAAVLRAGAEPQHYARTLLRFAEGSRVPSPAFASIGRTTSQLRLRVQTILQDSRQRPIGAISSRLIGWLAMASLTLTILAAPFVCHQTSTTSSSFKEDDLRSEAELRLQANPFPAE